MGKAKTNGHHSFFWAHYSNSHLISQMKITFSEYKLHIQQLLALHFAKLYEKILPVYHY